MEIGQDVVSAAFEVMRSRPKTILSALHLARPPFPATWLEWVMVPPAEIRRRGWLIVKHSLALTKRSCSVLSPMMSSLSLASAQFSRAEQVHMNPFRLTKRNWRRPARLSPKLYRPQRQPSPYARLTTAPCATVTVIAVDSGPDAKQARPARARLSDVWAYVWRPRAKPQPAQGSVGRSALLDHGLRLTQQKGRPSRDHPRVRTVSGPSGGDRRVCLMGAV
jgi:hypothetical protein